MSLQNLLSNPGFAQWLASLDPNQRARLMGQFPEGTNVPAPQPSGPAGGPDPVGPAGGQPPPFTPTDPRSLPAIGPQQAYGWDAYRRQARAATEGINRMPFVFGEFNRVPQDRGEAHALFYPPELQNFQREPEGAQRQELRSLMEMLMQSQEAGMSGMGGGLNNPLFRESGG